jgi:DNA-binding PucR family transcriptional regulator
VLERAALPVAKPKKDTLEWLRSISGELASATLKKLDDTLPWYREMPPSRRSAVGLVAQAGIQSFVSWFENPKSQPWVAADVFGGAPRELLRSVSLQETLQLIRVVVSIVEERVVAEDPSLREATLLYSREIAFSAADVYARAAEARGLWDARLEALVVDSIISGEQEEELASRIAALGWRAQGSIAVLVGPSPTSFDEDALRRIARKQRFDVLTGIQGNRVLVVLGRFPESDEDDSATKSFSDVALELESGFGPGTLVIGPEVSSISLGHISAKSALSAFAITKTLSKKTRLIHSDDLLAERALAGDSLAKAALIERLYRPLAKNSPELFQTLLTYLENGRSLETTAREMFVHPNTVRYRLKRIAELLDCDPTGAREAFILQVAVTLGTMAAGPKAKGKLN